MENYSYNSYPDSRESSPRSREIEFENPPPWEDQSQQAQSYKAKFMCSYGGKIQPRPHDNQLAYIGGETKIMSLDRTIRFSAMISKLSALCGGGGVDGDVSFKYQLPGEDLDALISVTNDDDLEHMMHEYDRLYRASAKPARMRLFVFPVTGSLNLDRERFVEALNTGPVPVPVPVGEKTAVDFFFGIEKGMAPASAPSPPPAVIIRDPAAEPVPPPSVPPPVPEIIPCDIQRQIHELQRLQIRDQEHLQELQRLQVRDQEQLAMYKKKNEEQQSPGTVQQQFPMTSPAPATGGFWPDKQISSGGFHSNVTAAAPGPSPPSDHPVYIVHAPVPGSTPSNFYHAPPTNPSPAPSSAQQQQRQQMVRPITGQAGQTGQGYYTNVQRMPHEVYRDQPVYNMVAQPPPTQHQQVARQPSSGVSDGAYGHVARQPSSGVSDGAYGHVAGYDRQVYYNAPGGVVPPQYHQGVGVAVNNENRGNVVDGKMVYKVSQGSI